MPDDPFSALGLPPSFDLTPEQIRKAWLQRSLMAHPDRAGIDDTEAREHSAALNDAKKTLEHEESRANALLHHLGGPSKENEKTLPDGFLMEIMELREQLETAHASVDPDAIEHSRTRANEERQRRLDRVRTLFAAASHDAETLRAIRIELNAWRYLERMLEQIDPAVS